MDRLLSVTAANVVRDLKAFPQKLGILGTVLDAKILHLPVMTALAIAREFGDEDLLRAMKSKGVPQKGDGTAKDRLLKSDLGIAFQGRSLGPRSRVIANATSKGAFGKLAEIAQQSDGKLNRAVGRALAAAGLITDFLTEEDLGQGMSRKTDISCRLPNDSKVRLEMMWRRKTSRAEIANYVLSKLYNYGRAIGFLVVGEP